MPAAPIFTARTIIRPMTLDDLDCLWEMDSDPDVMAYVGRPAYTDRKEFNAEMTGDFKRGERFKFMRMVALKDTGEPIGWLLFRPTEDGEWIEAGWRLVKRAWGKGYIPEAIGRLVNLAIADWGLNRYMAVLEAENKNSSRICEKLGMTYRGKTERYYDEELDIWSFDKTRQN
jgi:RimJ/RimL family protein N-acetyltransferase